MTEERARELLKPVLEHIRFEDEKGFRFEATDYATWVPGDDNVLLDGDFSADELEAIAWWMRNKT